MIRSQSKPRGSEAPGNSADRLIAIRDSVTSSSSAANADASAGTELPSDDTATIPSRAFTKVAPLVVTIVTGLICYGLFFRRGIWLAVIGYSVSPSERLLHGEIPYRDFLYNYTPGTLWFNAALMKLLGPKLLVINAGIFTFKMGVLISLFAAARRLLGGWLALVPVALSLGWIGHKYIFSVVPTQYSMVFTLLALIAMLKHKQTGASFWIFFSGVAIGAVLVFKYNVGILLLGCGLIAVVIAEASLRTSKPRRARLVPITLAMLLLSGFLLVAAVMSFYLMRDGAFGAMIDHFRHHAVQYGEERLVPLPSLRLAIPVVVAILVVIIGGAVVSKSLQKYLEIYIAVVCAMGTLVLLYPARAFVLKASATAVVAYLPIALFCTTAALVLTRLIRSLRTGEGSGPWWKRNGDLVICALFALGAYLEMYPRADYYHLVRVLPPIFLLLTLIAREAGTLFIVRFSNREPRPERAIWMTAAACLGLLLVVGIKDTWQPQFDTNGRFIDRTPVLLERTEGLLVPRKQADFIETLAGAIVLNSAPGDSVFSFTQRGSAFYFLTGRKNPTKFVWWRNVGVKEEERLAVLEMIGNRAPVLVLLQETLDDSSVRETVNANYRELNNVDGIGIFGRRNLALDTSGVSGDPIKQLER